MTKRPSKEDKEGESKALETGGGDCKFPVDSICWAKYGPLIYQAKVLKTKREKRETHLFVHYDGWNKKWDTWVAASDALENTPETAVEAERLKAKVKQDKENKKRRISTKDSDDEALVKDGSSKRGRRKSANGDAADPSIEPEEDEDSGKSQKVCLKIPGQLKRELINDWENITKNKRIVALPRPAGTVNTILADFAKAKSKNNVENTEQCEEMCNGIRVYFDRALPFVLLYHQERAQYKELVDSTQAATQKELVPSDVYGAEHLSRLFVKFPELLAHTQLTTPELGQLQPKLADFLKWFAKNPKYFGKQYSPMPADEPTESKGSA